MSYKLVVAPKAVDEFATLVRWWSENRPDSRLDLYEEFDRALEFLQSSPHAASPYRFDGRYLTYRFKTTPYVLLYRIDETDRVVYVVSAWSGQRGSSPDLP